MNTDTDSDSKVADDIARLMEASLVTTPPAPAPAPDAGADATPTAQELPSPSVETVKIKTRRGRRKKTITLPPDLVKQLSVGPLAGSLWSTGLGALFRLTEASPLSPEEETFQRDVMGAYAETVLPDTATLSPHMLPLVALVVALAPRAVPVTRSGAGWVVRLWRWAFGRDTTIPPTDGASQ